MNKINVSPLAQKDLEEIKRYINEELQNPTSAKSLIQKILKRIRDLINFPESGALLSNLIKIDNNYRYLVEGNYLIFYRYEPSNIYVDRIIYGKRDYIKIIFE